MGLASAEERLKDAQWHDEDLREALPLELCREGGSFRDEPRGPAWFGRAKTLLRRHLEAEKKSGHVDGLEGKGDALRDALDSALSSRQDLVRRKRKQLQEFMALSPAAWAVEG